MEEDPDTQAVAGLLFLLFLIGVGLIIHGLTFGDGVPLMVWVATPIILIRLLWMSRDKEGGV